MPGTTNSSQRQPSERDQADLALMSQIPQEVAQRIDQLFASGREAAQRDDAIRDTDAYPALEQPGASLQPEGQLFPVRTDVHIPVTPGLARSTCESCRMGKVSRWFRGIVFDETLYCEPCHFREAGSLTIQSAMARVALGQ